MESTTKFNEKHTLHDLSHYLPAQAPLKDFIHHNTLHAFQSLPFEEAIVKASAIFGYKVNLTIDEYRELYQKNLIREDILDRAIIKQFGKKDLPVWKNKLLLEEPAAEGLPRIGELRSFWKKQFRIDLDSLVHPILFRLLCSYLDQGISIWNFPIHEAGLLSSLRALERNTYNSFFKRPRARKLLEDENLSIESLLNILVGKDDLYERYLFDQQFAHQGWSGMVSSVEQNPSTLLDSRNITLKDLIMVECLLEIDALDVQFGEIWAPLYFKVDPMPEPLFDQVDFTENRMIFQIWQEAFEWSYYDQVLAGINFETSYVKESNARSFQALFCIDDRECSIRRYLEKFDGNCETYGTPGFFGVEFYFQPLNGKFYTKLCPAPVTPAYLIKETGSGIQRVKDLHFTKHSHSASGGFLISQTLGFWSAFKLFFSIIRPSMSPATASSFRHMDAASDLTIEHRGPEDFENGLQIGYTIEEMAVRVENVLRSIGLVEHFAPILYIVGHGSSSVNNPHYAAYDCGACSGRAGSVNARVLSFMANHPEVRNLLNQRGIYIPSDTRFVGGLHDTTRDEVVFYDIDKLDETYRKLHHENEKTFRIALDFNAKERSRRFKSINSKDTASKVHEKMLKRSVSLFEPRPELNHATNALCIVGRRELSKGLFLDRRSFLNSYNYKMDPEGKYLLNILKAAAPVCGGINLEYFFSRVDNQKLGAGTKLPHNVMGLFGVANGIDGDLRPGLPSQMIEIHDPVRLMIIVEQLPEVVLKTIQSHAETHEWFLNHWVHLTVVHPETRQFYYFENETFHIYQPLTENLKSVKDITPLIESDQENFPVYLIK